MKVKVTGSWTAKVEVPSTDEKGKETTDFFLAHFKEIDVPEIRDIESRRREQVRTLTQLRRDRLRLERRVRDRSSIRVENEKALAEREREIAKLEAEADALEPKIKEAEEALADHDLKLLDDVLLSVSKLEVEDADGELLSPQATRQYVLNKPQLLGYTVEAFSKQMPGAAQKNLLRSVG